MNQDGKVHLVTWSSQKGSKLLFGTWVKRWDMNSICSCDQTWKYWGQLCCLRVAIRTHPESKSEAQKSFQANPNHRSPSGLRRLCASVHSCTTTQLTSIWHKSRLFRKQKLSDVIFCFSDNWIAGEHAGFGSVLSCFFLPVLLFHFWENFLSFLFG